MTAWTSEQLQAIGDIEEIDVVTQETGGRARKPVTIWVVGVGNELYVRSARGRDGAWFQAAQARPEGQILAGGSAYDVSFVPESDPAINNRIDAAYRTKYDPKWAQYVPPVAGPDTHAFTLRIVPAGE